MPYLVIAPVAPRASLIAVMMTSPPLNQWSCLQWTRGSYCFRHMFFFSVFFSLHNSRSPLCQHSDDGHFVLLCPCLSDLIERENIFTRMMLCYAVAYGVILWLVRCNIVYIGKNPRFTAFLDSNLHTWLAIVTENELVLAFPPRNLPKKFRPDPFPFYLVIVVTNKQTDRQTN